MLICALTILAFLGAAVAIYDVVSVEPATVCGTGNC